ncbi:FMN-dependent NADH-azoreductase [Reyranella sp.]|uniref:FMN-dependent NADH-azoreductase n=1 Tax=Reyranella sp. TaxID=1929291 RepID=UPI003BA84D7B
MTNVLLVHSSLFGDKSESLAVARAYVSGLPDARVTERALSPSTVPHLEASTFAAMRTPAAELDAAQKSQLALSDTLVAEVEAADTIVLAVPMYNFSIPSTLKAWIDHVARAGRTFRYTEKGPEGLLTGRKVVIFASRGGVYSSESPAAAFDFQEPYLRAVLGFLGLGDVTVVPVEGLAMGPDAAASARAKAMAEAGRLAAAAAERKVA